MTLPWFRSPLALKFWPLPNIWMIFPEWFSIIIHQKMRKWHGKHNFWTVILLLINKYQWMTFHAKNFRWKLDTSCTLLSHTLYYHTHIILSYTYMYMTTCTVYEWMLPAGSNLTHVMPAPCLFNHVCRQCWGNCPFYDIFKVAWPLFSFLTFFDFEHHLN